MSPAVFVGHGQAVLDYAEPVFSCGWHVTRDGRDLCSLRLKAIVKVFGRVATVTCFSKLDDQAEACRRIFASDTRWTVVRGRGAEETLARGRGSGAGTWVPQSG
jgi:hypothetical protein